jgi:hypothetical protein
MQAHTSSGLLSISGLLLAGMLTAIAGASLPGPSHAASKQQITQEEEEKLKALDPRYAEQAARNAKILEQHAGHLASQGANAQLVAALRKGSTFYKNEATRIRNKKKNPPISLLGPSDPHPSKSKPGNAAGRKK